jgi:hypothetical protein
VLFKLCLVSQKKAAAAADAAAAAGGDFSYAQARVRIDGVEQQLVPIFANSFFPSLFKYVGSNDSNTTTTTSILHHHKNDNNETDATAAAAADPPPSDTLQPNNIGAATNNATYLMDPIRTDQITMSIQPHPEHPFKRVRIRATACNVTGTLAYDGPTTGLVSTATTTTGAAAASEEEEDDNYNNNHSERNCSTCHVNAATRVGTISIALDFGLESDNTTITFSPQDEFTLEDVVVLNFTITTTLGGDGTDCSGLNNNVGEERHLAPSREDRDAITAGARKLLRHRISQFILEHIGVRTFSLSRIPPIEGQYGQMQTILDIEAFMVSDGHVVLKGGAAFRAELMEPEWRAGRSLTPRAMSLQSDHANEEEDKFVQCSLGASGLNAITESAWYMSWAEAPTSEEEATLSNLCRPTPEDACPFPPMVAKSNTAMNVALGAFFLPSGLFKGFTVYALIPPPKFRFHADRNASTISGRTAALVYIDGTSRWSGSEVRLANITLPASVTAAIPSYDAATGHFHGLRIEKIRLEEPITKFIRQPYINRLAQFPFHFAEGTANAKLEEIIIPEVNKNIDEALSNMPLYINPLRNVPRKGLSTHFSLQSVHIYAVGQTNAAAETSSNDDDNNNSYLTLDADLTITVSGDGEEGRDPGELVDVAECGAGLEAGTCSANPTTTTVNTASAAS